MNIDKVSVKEIQNDDIVVDLPNDPLFHKVVKVKTITTFEDKIFFNGFNGTTIVKNINDKIYLLERNELERDI